jgi:NTE family protein
MKQTISLVLSGGAARGLAHIGVIEELERQGFEIKSIAGNSMGAFIAAMYVMNNLREYKEWVLTLDKVDVFKLIDFTFSSQGLIKGDRVFNKMKTFFPDKNIEDLKIPYVAVAADITNMKEVVFTEGSIYNAVRASVSIPTVFTPVKKDNTIMVDGGVVNPIPLNRVKRIEGDILIASYVNANIPYDKPEITKEDEERKNSVYKQKIIEFKNKLNEILPKNNKEHLNYFTLINKSTGLLTHHLSLMNIERYKPDMLINISRHSCGTFDFFKAEELIETGRRAAGKSINDYKTQLL